MPQLSRSRRRAPRGGQGILGAASRCCEGSAVETCCGHVGELPKRLIVRAWPRLCRSDSRDRCVAAARPCPARADGHG